MATQPLNGVPAPPGLDVVPEDIQKLLDFLEHEEHPFLRDAACRLADLLEHALDEEKGSQQAILEVLEGQVAWMRGNLMTHFSQEEDDLFPAIRELIRAEGSGEIASVPLDTLLGPVRHEHETALDECRRLGPHRGDFCLPRRTGEALQEAYQALRNFHQRLERHVWIEENRLIPAASKLQEDILERTE